MAKKKSISAPLGKKEANALLPDVENIGANEVGSGSLEANAPRTTRATAFSKSYTAEDIPALTDKVAETRKVAEAARQREIRSKVKLDTHINNIRKLQSGEKELDPMFRIPDSPQITAMNAKISIGRMITPPDEATIADTQRVQDKWSKVSGMHNLGSRTKNQDVANLLNTKGYLKGKTLNPSTGKKEPNQPWTAESVDQALIKRSMAQGQRPSSSIESHLRDLNRDAASTRTAAAREHLVAKAQLDEAKGGSADIQARGEALRALYASNEASANAPEVDASTGLPYGSRNTIARGKSKTDPAVEVIGEDQRKKQEAGLGSTDFADLQRSIHPLSSLIEPGGKNIKFPTHTRNPKTGEITPVSVQKKTPISGGSIDSMLLSVKQSHAGAITGGIPTTHALNHIADAHEGLLTLKTLVPKGTQIIGAKGDAHDFHGLLDTAIRGHKSANQAILNRVTKRGKAIRTTLPTKESVKEGLFESTKGNKTPVVQTVKGGRKVYDLAEVSGEATSGSAGKSLANVAGINKTPNDLEGNIPPEARASVIEYNRTKKPEIIDPKTERDIVAYAKRKSRTDAFNEGNGTSTTE